MVISTSAIRVLRTCIGVVDDISWLYECKYLPTYQTICLKVTDLSVTEDQNFLREMQVINSSASRWALI